VTVNLRLRAAQAIQRVFQQNAESVVSCHFSQAQLRSCLAVFRVNSHTTLTATFRLNSGSVPLHQIRRILEYPCGRVPGEIHPALAFVACAARAQVSCVRGVFFQAHGVHHLQRNTRVDRQDIETRACPVEVSSPSNRRRLSSYSLTRRMASLTKVSISGQRSGESPESTRQRPWRSAPSSSIGMASEQAQIFKSVGAEPGQYQRSRATELALARRRRPGHPRLPWA